MGSKSSSATRTNDVTQNLADNRVVEGDGAIIGGNITLSNTGEGAGTFNVTTTDFGALDAASEAVGAAFTQTQNSVNAVREIAGSAGASISAALNKVSDFATQTDPNASNSQTTKYVVIAVAVVAGLYAMRGFKK